ncbi:MAG: thiol:disulfide interchange protein DsbA/DsbL [Wenzhouxiangellaceae bacterium]|nr:thiol:disulfide interchange protein DsbA/DsbL [Wenzhouxiangellaceae bacterium]
MNLPRIATLFFAMLLLVAGAPALAQYQEGVHFERIDRPDAASAGDEIEVVEVFSYMCPHCRNFQPYVAAWEADLGEDVEFRRVPVVFNRSWEPFARAYYTASVLDMLGDSHEALFAALHDERRPIRTLSDLADFHAQFGIDADKFESTAKSFPVESRLRMGNANLGKWGVRSTPTLIIDNTWRVSPRRGGTFDEMLAVADWLLDRARAERGPAEDDTAEPESSEDPAAGS